MFKKIILLFFFNFFLIHTLKSQVDERIMDSINNNADVKFIIDSNFIKNINQYDYVLGMYADKYDNWDVICTELIKKDKVFKSLSFIKNGKFVGQYVILFETKKRGARFRNGQIYYKLKDDKFVIHLMFFKRKKISSKKLQTINDFKIKN